MQLIWSDWIPLYGAGKNKSLPTTAGLYRIRSRGEKTLEYIGQTGETVGLRRRLGQLSNVFGDLMPYNDPHTAGPGLWALLQERSIELQVSVCSLEGIDAQQRRGLECLAIFQHRKSFGCSPTLNFGRMPSGYSKSSQNNAALAKAGKRFRGGKVNEVLPCHSKSSVIFSQIEEVWSKARPKGWSPWMPIDEARLLATSTTGIYIIKSETDPSAVYIGEGRVRTRINAHLKKAKILGHRQGRFFSQKTKLSFSILETSTLSKNQMLEQENDFIAHHMVQFGTTPTAQFLG